MIWHTVLNVLWALIRNFLQGKHQCILLEEDNDYGEWVWECSCGDWGSGSSSEVAAIKDFHGHMDSKRKPVWV